MPDNRLAHLQRNFERYLSVQWRSGISPMERVLFCVYDRDSERALRKTFDEFRLRAVAAQHEWHEFDLTDTYAEWLGKLEYAERYFTKPRYLPKAYPQYRAWLVERFAAFAKTIPNPDNTVVALRGVGSLYGILRVREVIDEFAPLVSGRLAVFFPGTYANDNYHLLDQHDGWNYLAVPITSEQQF